MKKIAWIKKENLYDLDIPKIKNQLNIEHGKKYDEILTQALENYLGRTFNLEYDGKHTTLVETPDGNRHLFYNDKVIGVIKHNIAYDFDDFANNKVTCSISFIPNVKI